MIIRILSTFFITLRCETKSSKIMLKYPNTSKSSNKKTQRQENLSIQSQEDALNFNVLFKKSDIYIESADFIGNTMHLYAHSKWSDGICPYCGHKSERVHSRYFRTIVDLPVIGKGSVLHFHARKFFCDNNNCIKKTFAEQPGNEVFRYRRRTRRCEVVVTEHGSVCSSINAMHLLENMQIPINNCTILRDIHRINIPDNDGVESIGVDDWAFKKGVDYGSIIINLENSSFFGLLGDREQESFRKWLNSHQKVKVVSRDRSTDYSAAIASTGRNIIEVADRFHLIKNMSDCVTKVISNRYTAYRDAVRFPDSTEEESEPVLQDAEVKPGKNADNPIDIRTTMFSEVKELQEQGFKISAIARKLGIARQTVRKYMKWTSLQPARSKERKDYYLYDDYVAKLYLNEGKSLNFIFKELLRQGAKFSNTPFYNHYQYLIKERKIAKKGKMIKKPKDNRSPLLPIRVISHIVDKDIRGKDLTENEYKLISTLMNLQWFNEIRDAAKSFYEIIKGSNVAKLSSWLKYYQNTEIAKLKTFVIGIRLDIKAVENAIIYPISNGIVEGFVNKLKTIKRMLYGRASLELLKRKMYLTGNSFFN